MKWTNHQAHRININTNNRRFASRRHMLIYDAFDALNLHNINKHIACSNIYASYTLA